MKVINLKDDTPIEYEGAYRMSMDWYHAQCTTGPSISSTGLRKIDMQSPWHFWAESNLNPNRYPERDQSDSLILGKATHCLLLGDEVFDEQFIFVPDDAPNRPSPQQLKAYEENRATEIGTRSVEFWRDFNERAKGRLFLTSEQIQKIGYMTENVRRNPEAVQALTGTLTEISLIWQDEMTGVWLKSRPDVIPDNGFDFGDLKTFAPRSKTIERSVHQAITEHGYDMQMALAIMGVEAVAGTTANECVLVMVQSVAPYTVTPVRLDDETIYWAKVRLRKAINTFAHCLATGHWPMPVEGILDYSLPPSMSERFSEMQAEGELPNL